MTRLTPKRMIWKVPYVAENQGTSCVSVGKVSKHGQTQGTAVSSQSVTAACVRGSAAANTNCLAILGIIRASGGLVAAAGGSPSSSFMLMPF